MQCRKYLLAVLLCRTKSPPPCLHMVSGIILWKWESLELNPLWSSIKLSFVNLSLHLSTAAIQYQAQSMENQIFHRESVINWLKEIAFQGSLLMEMWWDWAWLRADDCQAAYQAAAPTRPPVCYFKEELISKPFSMLPFLVNSSVSLLKCDLMYPSWPWASYGARNDLEYWSFLYPLFPKH